MLVYSYRVVTEKTQRLEVRQNVLQPVTSDEDSGVMVTLRNRRKWLAEPVVTEKDYKTRYNERPAGHHSLVKIRSLTTRT